MRRHHTCWPQQSLLAEPIETERCPGLTACFEHLRRELLARSIFQPGPASLPRRVWLLPAAIARVSRLHQRKASWPVIARQ